MIEPKSQAKTCSAHAEILQQNDERTVYRLRETDGEVRITSYPVFPGIELAYHDVHAPSYRLAEPNAAGLIEIQHCREGRAEYCCGGEHYFLAPGDLSVVRRAAIEGEVEFPTGHYHGITVTLDPALAPDCLSCILQDVDVRPSVLAEKFFADSECFVSRSSARVEHIFSELYAVPAGIRRGYFKVKVLELLLFLSALDVAHEKHGYTAAQVRLARAARDALLHTMACKAAIKGGWKSDLSELRVLVDKVQSGEVQFCPHGRPVTVKLTKYELEKMFKRA